MFDAQGNYSPPDQETAHVLVVSEAFTGRLAGGGFPVPVAKGLVLATVSLGQTQIAAGMGPRHPKATLIEHATAKAGDVLPDDRVTPAIATAAAKQAAVARYRAEQAAKPKPAPEPPKLTLGSATLTEADIVALKALIAAKPA
jgi:hypothetical protein